MCWPASCYWVTNSHYLWLGYQVKVVCLISDKFPNYEELTICLKLLTGAKNVETVSTPVKITRFLSCYMLVPWNMTSTWQWNCKYEIQNNLSHWNWSTWLIQSNRSSLILILHNSSVCLNSANSSYLTLFVLTLLFLTSHKFLYTVIKNGSFAAGQLLDGAYII